MYDSVSDILFLPRSLPHAAKGKSKDTKPEAFMVKENKTTVDGRVIPSPWSW
jgi:hypothetical protein